MNVILFTRYTRKGASSRLRSYQYIPYFEKHGISVDVSPLFTDNYLNGYYFSRKKSIILVFYLYLKRAKVLFSIRKYDLIWIEKELFPWFPGTVEWLLPKFGVRYIVDYDDAIFHRYDKSRSIVIKVLLRKKISRVIKNASAVSVCNQYLKDYAINAGAKDIVRIPTVVDLSRYKLEKFHQNKVFTIGWIGSPSTAGYLDLVRKPLEKLGKLVKIRFVVVGAKIRPILGIDNDFIEWKEDTEISNINEFDVGIMPLLDKGWESGKCGYKLIQYMACHKPVVASSVGQNKNIVKHGENGYLANNESDWFEFLLLLIGDKGKCIELGKNGRFTVEREYSLEDSSRRLIELIRS